MANFYLEGRIHRLSVDVAAAEEHMVGE